MPESHLHDVPVLLGIAQTVRSKLAGDLTQHNIAIITVLFTAIGIAAVSVRWYVNLRIASVTAELEDYRGDIEQKHKAMIAVMEAGDQQVEERSKRHSDNNRLDRFGQQDFNDRMRLRDDLASKREDRLGVLEKNMLGLQTLVESYRRWTEKLSERTIQAKAALAENSAADRETAKEVQAIHTLQDKIEKMQRDVRERLSAMEKEIELRRRNGIATAPSYPLLPPRDQSK